MPLIPCGSCKKSLKVPDAVLGKAVKCPGCGQVTRTAAKSSSPAGPAPAPKAAPPPAPVPTEPISVECSFCGGRVEATADKAGTTVPCATCETEVKLPGTPGRAPPSAPKVVAPPMPAAPSNRLAAVAEPEAEAPPIPAPAAAAPTSILITCHGCKTKRKVPATLVGKGVKCPKCAQVVKVVAPAAPPAPAPTVNGTWGPEWIEVNVGVDAAGKAVTAPAATGGGATGDWGSQLLEGQDIAEKIQTDIKEALTRNEKLILVTRPRMDILIDKAKAFRFWTALIGGVITAVALVVMVCFLLAHHVFAGILIPSLFMTPALLVAYFGYRAPAKIIHDASVRATYCVTNRRVLIHSGSARTMRMASSGVARRAGVNRTTVMVGASRNTLTPFTGPELLRMRRVDSKKYEGAGDLYVGRSSFDEPSGLGFMSIDNVRDVEKMLREKLVNPFIDKLLSGTPLGAEDKRSLKQQEDSKDENIKDAPGVKKMRSTPIDDDNLKDAPGTGKKGAAIGDDNVKDGPASLVQRDLESMPEEARKHVEKELTAGEKIIWIGEPEASVKGRGLFGAMVGSAKRKEPKYELYAITNRRAILWDDEPGPISYYSPFLKDVGFETDDRVKNGGNVIFKVVKLVITHRDSKGNTSTEVQMHYMGLLHIRNYRAVARVLYETLVEPLGN